jgi:hypothetical protein
MISQEISAARFVKLHSEMFPARSLLSDILVRDYCENRSAFGTMKITPILSGVFCEEYSEIWLSYQPMRTQTHKIQKNLMRRLHSRDSFLELATSCIHAKGMK